MNGRIVKGNQNHSRKEGQQRENQGEEFGAVSDILRFSSLEQNHHGPQERDGDGQ
jgi:hypothetical protein